MIDIDKFMDSCKSYQGIIDKVTIDECISVAMGTPIGCNHEEMIVKAIVQRLWNAEQSRQQIRADTIEEYRLALHKKYADNKYLYQNNGIAYWNLDMEEVDDIAKQLKEQNK